MYVCLHQWGPATDEYLLEALKLSGVKMSDSGARTRRHELCLLGLVEWTEEYGLTENGRRTKIWRAVPFDEWQRSKDSEPEQQKLL